MRRGLAAANLALLLSAWGCADTLGTRFEVPQWVWRTPLEAPFATSDERPTTDGQRLYAIAGGLLSFDAATGSLVWTHSFTHTVPMNVQVHDGRVFAAEGVAIALDAATGRELWRFAPDSHGGFGESAVDEHAFYFGTASHRMYALDQETGSLLWSTDLGPDWAHTGVVRGAAVSGDTVYALAEQFNSGSGNLSTGWLFALDRQSGSILWSYRNGDGADERNLMASPAVVGRVIVAGDLPGNAIIGVDRFTGLEIWRIGGAAGKYGPDQPPIGLGRTVYIASNDNHVYAVDAPTGELIWKTKTPASNHGLAVCGERIFVGWLGLSVLDRQTGRVLRQSRPEASEYPTSGFAVDGANRVFVLGNRAAYAYACD